MSYLLTPWSRAHLEKLTGSQLVKNFPTFYGTRRFITTFTSAHHLSISWVSSIQSIPPHPIFWRSILTLWGRNYFFDFCTSCIWSVSGTGAKQVGVVKQTAFWRGKKKWRVWSMFGVFGAYICWIGIWGAAFGGWRCGATHVWVVGCQMVNIILPSTPGSLKWALSFRLLHQNAVYTSPFTHTRYMPRPSRSRFYHPNRTGWAGMSYKI